MRLTTLQAFADELEKISTAGDLMSPAVVSDSAVVEGPPAKPFTRRRGYHRLEKTFEKEGAFKEIGNIVKKTSDKIGAKAFKAYVRAPRPIRKLVDFGHQSLMGPQGDGSDMTSGVVLHHLLRKLSAAKVRGRGGQ